MKIIGLRSEILGLNIAEKVADLRDLGFIDPVKMITWNPVILTYARNNIGLKITELRELGFADPVKMITSFPMILSYAIDNIRGKIAELRELGFSEPVKMITRSPPILGLAKGNIRGKVADLHELGFDHLMMIKLHPAILGYARERLLLCGRIVTRLQGDERNQKFTWLIKQPRTIIDAIEATQLRTWSEIRAMIAAGRKGVKL